MNEFEKWRENDSRGAGIWTTAAYEKGWKAALEWMLSKVQYQQNLAHYRQDLLWGFEKDIKEELED